jgi:Cyclic nucleotide-binding domain
MRGSTLLDGAAARLVPTFVARSALRAAGYHALFVAGVTIVKSATNAMFLSRADPVHLPWLYGAVAIGVALVTIIVTRFQRRFIAARVHVGSVVVAAAAMAVATAAVVVRIPYATGVLYVLGEVSATIGSVLFWSRVMDAFTARDQKRIVGWVGAGGMLGAVLGGGLVSLVVGFTGVWPLLLVALLLWVVALPLLRGVRGRGAAHEGASATGRSPALHYLAHAPFPRAVAGLVVSFAALGAFTDFVFRRAAAASQTEEQMAGLFGLLNAVVGAAVVVFQLGMTTRLLQRLGVFAFAAIVPLTLFVLAIAGFALPPGSAQLQVLLALKGVEMAGAFSLHPAAVALLYNPMPVALRAQTRTLIDGTIKKLGVALAGVALVLVADYLTPGMDALAVAVVALSSVLLLPGLRRRYIEALAGRLQQKAGDPTVIRVDPDDRDTRNILEAGLRSPHPEEVIVALEMLPVLSREALLLLLDHDDERVRTLALQRVPDAHDEVLAQRLVAMANRQGARRPRAEAVRAMRLVSAAAGALALPLVEDVEPGVACAALEVVLKDNRNQSLARAKLQSLVDTLASQTPAWRREVARLLGRLAWPSFNPVLVVLINDGDASVRSLAVAAAAREDDAALVPSLIAHLSDRAIRTTVADALVHFGDRAVPALREVLDDRKTPVSVRAHVPRILERIGTEATAEALLYSNPRDDAFLQVRIGTALRVVAERTHLVVDRKRTDAAIGRRLVAMHAYDEALVDLRSLASDSAKEVDHTRLLRRIVDDRRRQNLTIAMDLLALHRGSERILPVLRGLLGDSAHARADALELLDVALAGDHLRGTFLNLLERPSRQSPAAAGLSRTVALCRSRDPLLRGVARVSARRMGIPLSFGDDEELTGTGSVGPGAFELEGDDMADPLLERLFLLEHVDLFAGLAADDVLAIAAIATEQVVEAGETLYREGEMGTSLFVLIEGSVELTRAGKTIMTLQGGESAGQVSFLDRGPRPVTARVSPRAGARLLRVERDAFMDLMADRSSLMHAFFGVLAQRLRSLIEARGGS